VLALGLALPAAAAADGKALFSSKCAMCHGADGTPKKMAEGSKAFTDAGFKKDHTAEAVTKIMKEGKGKMKPVKLTDEEMKAVADFVVAMPAK